MKFLVLIVAIIYFCNFSNKNVVASGPNDPTYKAGVIEFVPSFSWDTYEWTEENIAEHMKIFNSPEVEGLDIIVTAEYAINYVWTTVAVPDPEARVNPCDSRDFTEDNVLKKFSCVARRRKFYIVVNLIEHFDCRPNCPRRRRWLYYNTSVVIDRNGTIIARYRKYHLFNESVDQAPAPEAVTFKTDFGVTFGILICFDINFYDPPLRLIRDYNVTDFVMSSDWYSELPQGTAVQIQQNWAYSHNVNLLAAGANKPWEASSGSGIYAGRLGPVISTMSGVAVTKLLVGEVPKRNSGIRSVPNRSIRNTPQTMNAFYTLREDLDSYTNVEIPINRPTFDQTICSRDRSLCCDYNLVMSFNSVGLSDRYYRYRAVVFDGMRTVMDIPTGLVSTCIIVACTNNDISSCGYRFSGNRAVREAFVFDEISISGNFQLNQNDFYIPNSVDTSLLPLHPTEFSYSERNTAVQRQRKISIQLKSQRSNLLSFGIFGRRF